jgi:Uma2 family endonuclease
MTTMQLEAQLSHADYERLLALPENQGRRLELLHGEVVETMPTFFHGQIALAVAMAIRLYLLSQPVGQVSIEARYRPEDGSANDFIPDVSLIRDAARIPQEGPILGMPDLAVEILSPGQSEKYLLDKALLYLRYGAQVVWLIYPTKRLVEVLSSTERLLLREEDTLEGGALLPGFSTPVKALFTP